MILVDTSVWIYHFKATVTLETELLAVALAQPRNVVVGDVVLLELLRGVSSPREAAQIEATFAGLPTATLMNFDIARAASSHYWRLRAVGCTPRKLGDLIIGTWCIENDIPLLHRDRDFALMQMHCGLKAVEAFRH